MQYIVLIFAISIALLGYIKEKNIYNPLTVFYSIFTIMIFLATLTLFGINETSQYTYTVIFIGLVSFLIGYFLIELTKSKNNTNKVMINKDIFLKYQIRYKIILVISLVIIIFLSYNALQSMGALLQGYSLAQVRSNTLEIVNLPGWYSLSNQYLVRPMVLALIPIAVIDLFVGKKKLLLPVFIIIVLTAFGDGGRFIFYYFLVQCVIAAIIFKKRLGLSRKMKQSLITIIIFSVLLVLSITNLREVSVSLIEHLYLYISASIPHLDYRIEVIENLQANTYGLNYFMGYLTPMFVILNGLGLLEYPEFYNEANTLAYVENFVRIGSETTFNAFVTPFFYFYLDGGLIGVIFGSILYGIILAVSYYHIKNKYNIYNLSVYLLLMQGVFTSMVRWQFIMPAYALSFIYIIFLIKRKK